jgi:hypothetical protein
MNEGGKEKVGKDKAERWRWRECERWSGKGNKRDLGKHDIYAMLYRRHHRSKCAGTEACICESFQSQRARGFMPRKGGWSVRFWRVDWRVRLGTNPQEVIQWPLRVCVCVRPGRRNRRSDKNKKQAKN